MKFCYSIFLIFLVFNSAHSAEYNKDRDVVLIDLASENFSLLYKNYLDAATDWKVREDSIGKLNHDIFLLWLMYAGPWQFDVSNKSIAPKYIANIRKAYKSNLWNAPNLYDPLGTRNQLKGSKQLKDCLQFGSISNLDTSEVRTLSDYDNLILLYVKWLQ